MQEYAYVRVSSKEQNEDRQLTQMRSRHILEQNIYIDKQSGKDFNRPQYNKMINRILPGDLIYVLSIDRLGRNYEEILHQWKLITKDKKVDICVIDMPMLDTRRGKDLMGTFIADLVLQILSFVAENERNSIKERQSQGIEAAKARGVVFGRPRIEVPDNFAKIMEQLEMGTISVEEAMRQCKMKKSTFYRRVNEYYA